MNISVKHSKSSSKAKKLIIAGALIIIAPVLAYAGLVYYIKLNGIRIFPPGKIKPVEVEYYLQNDKRWAAEKLGTSQNTIGSEGCLISSIAAANSKLDKTITPEELNELFIRKGVFTESGQVVWNRINKALPGVDYSYKRIFSGSAITNDLLNGRMPIVKVKYRNGWVDHWVLVVGATEDDFLAMDPLNKDRKYIELYKTHGRVYAYRHLYLVE